MPCSTQVVQAELFYGLKGSLVSFSFRDHQTGKVFAMFTPDQAAQIEDRLQEKGMPLLAGGSAYSDIFSGGADETHFCITTLGVRSIFKHRYPFGFILLILLNIYSLVRTAVLMIIETGLAVYDFVGGLIQGQDLWKELKFVPSRVIVCALLRELITIGAKIDIARGLPVIHLNFMGYHEQSHRRGASSLFAHWTLRGIDEAIQRVWKAAHRSTLRDYSVWLYSDHGQVDSTPYAKVHGRSIQQAVTEALSEFDLADSKPVVEALGPMGHIYLDSPVPTQLRDNVAQKLIADAQIPMVLMAEADGRVRVWQKDGSFYLPDEADRLFDNAPPFYRQMLEDFLAIFRHPDCGQIVVLGGSPFSTEYFSFATESGAHGGITPEEAEGFALLPSDVNPDRLEKGYLRPMDLRNEALYLLHRTDRPEPTVCAKPASKTLRVMSYNVHGCVGMDGHLSPGRIARVIAQYDPHIVALQELDVGRRRSGGLDQAERIASCLNMDHHFHPTLRIAEESFGDAVLSVFPLKLIKRQSLLRHPRYAFLEPRGALWVQVEFNGKTIQLINTHLGLMKQERLLHTEELLSDAWLGSPDCTDPVILCGDFNAFPGSRVVRRFQSRLTDIGDPVQQRRLRRKGTWFGRYPLIRLDHIFVSPGCRILSVDVCDSYLSQIASDHRPLLVEIAF
jgi:endonuclease/exonuclease/phosphatase family metal-dependent hydrolase